MRLRDNTRPQERGRASRARSSPCRKGRRLRARPARMEGTSLAHPDLITCVPRMRNKRENVSFLPELLCLWRAATPTPLRLCVSDLLQQLSRGKTWVLCWLVRGLPQTARSLLHFLTLHLALSLSHTTFSL